MCRATGNELVVGSVAKYWAFDFTSDEAKIAISQGDGRTHVYDFSSGKEEKQLEFDGVATVLSYSPDNRQLAIVQSAKPSLLRIVETTCSIDRRRYNFRW